MVIGYFAWRKAIQVLGLVGAMAALSACDPSMFQKPGGTTTAATASQPLNVALLIPKTNQSAGLVADSLEKSARLAVADLADIPITLSVYDTRGDADMAASQAQKAVNDGAQIILGPLFAEAANAADIALANSNVNILSFSNNTSIAGGKLFVLGQTFANTANRLVSFAKKQGKSRGIIIHPKTVEGEFARAAFAQAAAQNGLAIANTIGFEFSQAGVVNSVPAIKTALSDTSVDIVLITSNSAGTLPLLTQLLDDAGINSSVAQYIGISRWDTPSTILDLPGIQNAWFALPDQARVATFSQRYQAAYGSSPHDLGPLAYDGIMALGALIKAGHRKPLSRAALTQGAGFDGASGILRLRSDGTNERSQAVAQIVNKQVVILDPAPQRFTGVGF